MDKVMQTAKLLGYTCKITVVLNERPYNSLQGYYVDVVAPNGNTIVVAVKYYAPLSNYVRVVERQALNHPIVVDHIWIGFGVELPGPPKI
jgi:hypothetical protein